MDAHLNYNNGKKGKKVLKINYGGIIVDKNLSSQDHCYT